MPGDTFVSHNGGEWVEVQNANPEQQRFDPLAPTWMVLAADNETVEGSEPIILYPSYTPFIHLNSRTYIYVHPLYMYIHHMYTIYTP